MNNDEYTVVDVFWPEAGITIQVVKIPYGAIEEKLALLSREDGVSKHEYYHFLLSKCLLDTDMIGRYVSALSKTDEEFEKVVFGVVRCILEVNEMLNPDVLIMSSNNVIRLPIHADNEKKPKLLSDNPRWNDDFVDLVDDVLDQLIDQLGDDDSFIDEDYDFSDIPYEEVETVMWNEASLPVNIKKFKSAEIKKVFDERPSFLTERHYRAFVLAVCISGYWKLWATIEKEGIPLDVTMDDIIVVLYDMCIEINPFMEVTYACEKKYITIADLETKTRSKLPNSKKTPTNNKSSSATVKTATAKAKKEKRTFSSVKKKELLSLGTRMGKRLIGQQEAINAITEAVQVAGAGLRDPAKPIGAFLLTGDTGTGKTLCSKVLAQELMGNENHIIRIDCSEYAYGHEISKLIGAPTGYVGYDNGGVLTNKVLANPFSVVLFDELEKAHSKLYDILLQILDEGRLTDNQGKVCDFSDSVILMTSNIGVKQVKAVGKTVGFGDVASTTHEKRRAAISSALKSHFKPEFLNRLDSVVTFNTLGKKESYKIIDLELEIVAKYLTERGTSIEVSKKVKDKLFDVGFSKAYGARELKRAIERLVAKPLALKILRGDIPDKAHVLVNLNDNDIVFTYKNNAISKTHETNTSGGSRPSNRSEH